MLSIERREEILKLMRQRQTVSVDDLSSRFFVSAATIRRDLDRLSRENLIKRTYGGAVLLDGGSSDIPLPLREGENIGAKERIAAQAVKLIADGSTIFLDSSTTVSRLAPYLSDFNGLTVVTNALKLALKLGESNRIRVYCAGGLVRENSISIVGTTARDYLSAFNADLFFFSCRGFSFEKGITEASHDESEIKRQMLRSAGKKVLLCDSSKLNSTFFSTICQLSDIDILISDAGFDTREQELLSRAGVRLIGCDP